MKLAGRRGMMPELTLESICKVTGGSPVGPGELLPLGYSIDTRTLKAGDLFFAIIGPNHDGHRFAGDAIAKGATGLVVSDPAVIPRPPQATVPAIVVPDTLRALQDLAAFARRGKSAKVVAITGSSGKTTTKEMTRQVMAAAFRRRGRRLAQDLQRVPHGRGIRVVRVVQDPHRLLEPHHLATHDERREVGQARGHALQVDPQHVSRAQRREGVVHVVHAGEPRAHVDAVQPAVVGVADLE